jgi:hypothetical protein
MGNGVLMAASVPRSAVRRLKADGPRIVWLIQRDGQGPRVLKQWPLTPWRALKYLFGVSAPQRLVRGNGVLHDIGIPVPKVLSRPRIVADGGELRVDTELLFIPGRDGWQVLRDAADAGSLDSAHMRKVAGSIGDIITRLIRHRLFHRDLTIGNFVIDDAAGVWIVDTDGVRRMRNPVREIERMLGRLAARPIESRSILPGGLYRLVLFKATRPLPREVRRALLRDLHAQPWVQELLRVSKAPHG